MDGHEGQFKEIFEKSPIGILFYNKKCELVKTNQSALEILGIPSLKVLKEVNLFDKLLVKIHKERLLKKEYLQFQTAINLEKITYPLKKGIIYIDYTISITDSGYLIQVQDISEQKKAEKELKQTRENLELKIKEKTNELEKAYKSIKESEKKYLTLYKAAPVGIFHSTSKGKFIDVNPELAHIFGYDSPNELILAANKTSIDIIYADFDSRTQIVKQAIKTNDWVRTEMQYLRKDGKVILLDVAFRNIGKIEEDNYLLEGFAIDITAQKKAEEQLKDTIQELERSNEELEQFAYVASHDLQEPLRTIASFTQLLEHRYRGKFDSDADEFMDYIVEAAKRMKEQIIGLLEYSRVGSKEKEFKIVDMNKILNQTIRSLHNSIKESNAQIIIDDLPEIMGDAGQLQRVFQNLISNAIKFRKYEEPLKIYISANKNIYNSEYVFNIRDNGIGIEPQYAERIFTIFQQLHTRKVYEGTGIGLSIVKRIIERHGGRIWVESSFGVGSTFYFTIPRTSIGSITIENIYPKNLLNLGKIW